MASSVGGRTRFLQVLEDTFRQLMDFAVAGLFVSLVLAGSTGSQAICGEPAAGEMVRD